MPPEFLWSVVALALVLLAGGTWGAYAVWVELRSIRGLVRKLAAHQGELVERQHKLTAEQRGMRQQLGNMISMLMRAGFKRGPARDWSDDEAQTTVLGESTETKWDWRTPADG
jgi:hypothetical protein